MKAFCLFFLVLGSIFAFFAKANMLPNWVHFICSRGYDKHAHCLIFFVLEILCVLVFRDFSPLSIAAFLAVCGVLVEVIQQFTGRSFCVLDIFADMAGILLGLFLVAFAASAHATDNIF